MYKEKTLMDTSDLAKRMKDYESISKTRLMKRCPVICRVDGKAHHSFTRGFKKPFDEVYMKSMQETTKYLCENIQGVVLGYTQSDEITLVFIDYEKLNTSPYFDYEVQKLCSIIASMATMAFNKFFAKNVKEYDMDWKCSLTPQCVEIQKAHYDYMEVLYKAVKKGAMFDARVFNIPKEEVANLIYWRQLDATRNSIQMVGQANFSHKELQNKSCNNIQDMLMTQKGINWNDFPVYQKRGSCVIKEEYAVNKDGEEVEIDYISDVDEPVEEFTIRTRWIIDKNIPIFRGLSRDYIEKLILADE